MNSTPWMCFSKSHILLRWFTIVFPSAFCGQSLHAHNVVSVFHGLSALNGRRKRHLLETDVPQLYCNATKRTFILHVPMDGNDDLTSDF